MLAIQPRRGLERDKELRAVGVGTGVGHAHNAGARVFEVSRNFVFKLATVDGFTAPSRTRGVAHLAHEIADNAVHRSVVVVALVGERRHVVARPGGVLVIQFNDKGSDGRVKADVGKGAIIGFGHGGGAGGENGQLSRWMILVGFVEASCFCCCCCCCGRLVVERKALCDRKP